MAISRTVEQQLLDASVLLNNILQDDLVGSLVDFGYGDTDLQEGMALLSAAKVKVTGRQSKAAAQVRATATLNTAKKEAHRQYMVLVKMSKVALKDYPSYITELSLDVPRKTRFDLWRFQAMDFLNKALESTAIVSVLSLQGITSERLTAVKTLFVNLETLNNQQKDAIGLAQVATVEKRNAMKALHKVVSGLRTACRIAFKDDPQQLERLGIHVPSDGYVPKPTEEDPPEEPEEDPPTGEDDGTTTT